MMEAGQESRRPIRFGIICSGTTFPAWQASCSESLLRLDSVELALLIVDAAPQSRGWRKFRLREFLWYAYDLLIAGRSRAMRPVDMAEALQDVPVLRCRIRRKGKFSQYFQDDDVESIKDRSLDFVLRFGFNIIRGEVLQAATYGVWSFHHGDEEKYRGVPPGFWEIYNGDPVTGSILQRLTDRLDGGVVLRKGFLKTRDISYVLNRDQMYFESASWPAQVCADILQGTAGFLGGAPSRTSAPILRRPGNVQMALFFWRILRNVGRSAEFFTRYDRWNVGVVSRPVSSFLNGGGDPSEVHWLSPPSPTQFWADPFAIAREGGLHLLFEEFDYRTSKGQI